MSFSSNLQQSPVYYPFTEECSFDPVESSDIFNSPEVISPEEGAFQSHFPSQLHLTSKHDHQPQVPVNVHSPTIDHPFLPNSPPHSNVNFQLIDSPEHEISNSLGPPNVSLNKDKPTWF